MCYIDSELWESKFDGLLSLVKEYIVDVWKIHNNLYDSDSGSGLLLYSPSPERGIVSSVTMVSLVRIISLVRIVKCI